MRKPTKVKVQKNMACKVSSEVLLCDAKKSPDELKELILKLDKPVLIQGKLESWRLARQWSPCQLCQRLRQKRTTFKLCPKRGTPTFHKKFKENENIFETQCEHVEGTFSDFLEWLQCHVSGREVNPTIQASSGGGNLEEVLSVETSGRESETQQPKRLKLEPQETGPRVSVSNPLLQYPRSDYWVYADYKYMCQLCSDMPEMQSAVDWSVFGFEERDGKDSTLWIGSEGACTPCHYDTYGCNLVAQLWGKKKWILFPPEDSERLYPTRIPYEESSVFSAVNTVCPDLQKYPKFAEANAHEVTLSAGDVLFVPQHWWHYVECVEPAVSVNTWIELPSDTGDRLKEAVVRTLVSAMAVESEPSVTMVNPNEVLFAHKENLQLLSMALSERVAQLGPERSGQHQHQLSSRAFLHTVTSDAVVQSIVDELMKRSQE